MRKNYANKNKSDMDFKTMAKKVNLLLRDNFSISLNFFGYTDFIRQYIQLQDINLTGTFTLAKEANLWANYMSEVDGLIQHYLLLFELQADILKAEKINKVPNPELDVRITTLINNMNCLKLFRNQLNGQIKFFHKAHLKCLQTHKNGIYKLLSTTN